MKSQKLYSVSIKLSGENYTWSVSSEDALDERDAMTVAMKQLKEELKHLGNDEIEVIGVNNIYFT